MTAQAFTPKHVETAMYAQFDVLRDAITPPYHLTDDGCDDMTAALDLASELFDMWHNDDVQRFRHYFDPDSDQFIHTGYACDGVSNYMYELAERVVNYSDEQRDLYGIDPAPDDGERYDWTLPIVE